MVCTGGGSTGGGGFTGSNLVPLFCWVGWGFWAAWPARMLLTKLATAAPAFLGGPDDDPSACPESELIASRTERPALEVAIFSATGLAAEAIVLTIDSTAAESAKDDGLADEDDDGEALAPGLGGITLVWDSTRMGREPGEACPAEGDEAFFCSEREETKSEALFAACVAALMATLRTIGLLSRVIRVAPLPTFLPLNLAMP